MTVELCGRRVPTLSPEDLLLPRCTWRAQNTHGHGCAAQRHRHLIYRADLDQDTYVRRAERWHIAG